MSNNRWKQDKFILSTFQGGTNEQTLSLLKGAGFNLVEFTFMTREAVTSALEACEKLGLPSLVQDRGFGGIGDGFPKGKDQNVTEEDVIESLAYYSRFSSIMGYYVWDEPTADRFEDCRRITDLFRKHAPDKLAFSVVFPSYGVYTWKQGEYNWENNSYVQYINNYLSIVDPDVFSMDYYVFQMNRGIGELNYYDLWRDLGYCRKKALELDKPLWFYYQGLGSFAPEDNDFIADMTPEKIRVQMSSALAYGVKQLSCFCASRLIFDDQGIKTHMYEPVKEINADIQAMGDYLLDKTSYRLYHTGINKEYNLPYFLDDMEQDDIIQKAEGGLIIGRLYDNDCNYLVVVNKEFTKNAAGRLLLKDDYRIRLFDRNTGSLTQQESRDFIHYDLACGDCAIYQLEALN